LLFRAIHVVFWAFPVQALLLFLTFNWWVWTIFFIWFDNFSDSTRLHNFLAVSTFDCIVARYFRWVSSIWFALSFFHFDIIIVELSFGFSSSLEWLGFIRAFIVIEGHISETLWCVIWISDYIIMHPLSFNLLKFLKRCRHYWRWLFILINFI